MIRHLNHPHLSRAARTNTRLLGTLCFTLFLLAGCGDSTDRRDVQEVEGWNLLGRGADVIQDQVGELIPGSSVGSEQDPWGRLGRMGWEKEISQSDSNRYVRSTGSRAFLTLPIAVARDREIELEAWLAPSAGMVSSGSGAVEDSGETPNSKRTVSAQVLLNGVLMGSLVLSTEPTSTTVSAPSAAWIEGDNLLSIVFDEGDSTSPERLALGRVVYDTPRKVRHSTAKGEATLEANTALGFLVEPMAAAKLRIDALAQSPGVMSLSVTSVDRATGALGAELYSLEIPLEAQSIQRGLALPDQTGQLLRVLVRWSAPGKQAQDLVLQRLALVEEVDVARPPIILISIDTLRATSTSVYGYGRDTTPALQALAADGIVYDRCITNAPWTLPSFLGLMTGLFPGSHRRESSGLGKGRQTDLWERWYLTDNRWTLAEALRSRGYRTGGWVDSVWLRDRFNFPQGFEDFDSSASLIEKADPDGGLMHQAKGAMEWLGQMRPNEPYFMFLHGFDVHGPYSPDDDHTGLYREDLDSTSLTPAGAVANTFRGIPEYITAAQPSLWREGKISAPLVRATYDEGIRMTDTILGLFLEELRQRGLYDEALIVVTSDHGETMDEGPYYFGHGLVEEGILHIPLVVKLPNNRRAGTRVSRAVSLVDLYPSILAVAGSAPEPDGNSGEHLHGRSIFDAEGPRDLPARAMFTESGLCQQFSLELDGWRLVESWPGRDSTAEFVLTHPLTLALLEKASDATSAARGVKQTTLDQLRADATLAKWIRTSQEQGLKQAALTAFRSDPTFAKRIDLLRRAHGGPYRFLYNLREDPDCRNNLVEENPERLAQLAEATQQVIARRKEAQGRAVSPIEPAPFSAEQLQELSDLGYVENQ